MPALTPEFLFRFENNMRAIQDQEYARMASKLWWSQITKVVPSGSGKELMAWILSTAQLEDVGVQGGNITFDDMASVFTQFENRTAAKGLKLFRNQIEDLDGKGLQFGAEWSAQMGAYMAYWPQKKVVELLQTGDSGSVKSFDGSDFFGTDHPYNPFATELGTYSNLFTSSTYDISGADIDAARVALNKITAAIRSVKMPNGVDPRFLTPTRIIAPPAMQANVTQLMRAKFLAQGTGSAGGSGDVEAAITTFGWKEPIIADELAPLPTDDGTVTGHKNKTFYVACEQIASSQLGALVYVDREPFKITYYTGQGGGTGVDAILDRARELEWHCQGRNVCGPGLPYLIYKVTPY
jgi:phage major head subunit gpT-like protein